MPSVCPPTYCGIKKPERKRQTAWFDSGLKKHATALDSLIVLSVLSAVGCLISIHYSLEKPVFR